MKTKQEIHDRIAKDLQALLEFAKPTCMNEALDVIAMHIEAGGVYLASACSRKQAADALRTMADYVTEVKFPTVAIVVAPDLGGNPTKH